MASGKKSIKKETPLNSAENRRNEEHKESKGKNSLTSKVQTEQLSPTFRAHEVQCPSHQKNPKSQASATKLMPKQASKVPHFPQNLDSR